MLLLCHMWNAMELKVKIFSNSAVSKKNICLKLTFSSHTYFPAPLRTGIEVKRVENDSSCLFWRLLGLLVVWLGLLWCYSRFWICSEVSILDIRDGSRFSNIRLVDLIIECLLGCAILFSKGIPTLGVLNQTGRSLVCRPWLGCKRWARVRFSWTRAWHKSTNRAGERNFWYVQPDCVNNRPVKQYIVRGPFVIVSQTTQNNKPQS